MKNVTIAIFATFIVMMFVAIIVEAQEIATLRHDTKIDVQKRPSAIPKVDNRDIKKSRNYPMQPPLIPHQTRDYQIDRNVNKCMSCHSRRNVSDSQATMVSVTHYMDRDGNFLAEISPRRYFCHQCHVTQSETKSLVDNTFTDMYSLMDQKSTSNN